MNLTAEIAITVLFILLALLPFVLVALEIWSQVSTWPVRTEKKPRQKKPKLRVVKGGKL